MSSGMNRPHLVPFSYNEEYKNYGTKLQIVAKIGHISPCTEKIGRDWKMVIVFEIYRLKFSRNNPQ